MSKYRMMDITRNLHFRIQSSGNDSFVAYVENRGGESDNIGALYYVVAVVLIYGLSIVMMIASHIRKNKQDNQLRTYLKEMAILRKKNRREQLLEKMTDLATKTNPPMKETALVDRQRLESDRFHHPPTYDDESRDWLLCKNSASENDDSVFQLPADYCIEANKSKSPSPKLITPKATPKPEGKSFLHIQVINENVPL